MSLYGELFDTEKAKDEESGLMAGIVLGEVVENWDKDHPGMVKVQVLLGAAENNDIGWVPVATAYAGNAYGVYLLPEIGSQVLIAFHMGQIKSPYVIGCLWNQKNVLPADAANEKNTVKTILTKGGNCIAVSDEEGKERITLKTKGGLCAELDDEKQKLALFDKNRENALYLDSKEGTITLESKKKAVFMVGKKEWLAYDANASKLTVKADHIRVEAGQKLELKGQNTNLSGGNTAISGQNVKIEAQASLALKGTASLKAESSGLTELKGSLLKLN